MNLYLSSNEINLIASAIKDKPWCEVNNLMLKLSAVPMSEVMENIPQLEAPYGYKKDGSPKARPGRKAIVKRKVRQ